MKSRTSEKTISEIFNKGIFRIPDYQRGYAWKNYELEKFWQDLMNLQEERFHYTGTISLEKTNGRDWHDSQKLIQARFSPYYIVDGQQRSLALAKSKNNQGNFITLFHFSPLTFYSKNIQVEIFLSLIRSDARCSIPELIFILKKNQRSC